MKMVVERNEKDAQTEYMFVIHDGDIEQLRLTELDRAVLTECQPGRAITSDVLLGLGVLFRRAEEQEREKQSKVKT